MDAKQFLESKGLQPNHIDNTVNMKELIEFMKAYATIIRNQQIEYCAISATTISALNIRGTNDQLDNDLVRFLKVPKVII